VQSYRYTVALLRLGPREPTAYFACGHYQLALEQSGETVTETCTLCDLPLAETAVESDDGERFCCQGCLHVHETLDERDELSVEDGAEALEPDEREVPADHDTTFLRVDGMHCATCETFIEARASEREGVSAVDASYITDTARIDHDPEHTSEDDLREDLTGLGYRAYAKDDPKGERQSRDRVLVRLIVGVVFGMMVMMNYIAIIYPTYFRGLFPDTYATFLTEMLESTSAEYFYLVVGFMAVIVLLFTGGPILKGAYVSARTRQPNMDLLVAIAATSAWVYSTLAIFIGDSPPHVYYDVTVAVVLVVTAGSYYENGIKRKATDRLADLTEAQVDTARRYTPDGPGEEVPVGELSAGERVLVREGERVPVDGTVAEGEGTVDEAVVTGESLPVPKRAEDVVVGGSLLQEGSLVVTVGEGATSSVGRITDMVWNLQSNTHGIQQLADRLATVFVPLVFALAVTVGVVNLLLGASISTTMLLALTVLIVSCPCALGLATPLAIASSVREALERGIVVFDETIFERLRDVDAVVFDKTGTLTTGEMRVRRAEGPDALFERAALLEARTSHPIAAAVADAYAPGGESREDAESSVVTDGGVAAASSADSAPDVESRVTDFESHPTGVEGVVDGERVLVGNPDLFAAAGWTVPETLATGAEEATAGGDVPVLVGTDGQAAGLLVVGDEPREEWAEAVAAIGDRNVEVAVLTGDDERAAAQFRNHDAIDEVFAGVPPEAKAETVARLGDDGTTVMVGDGTNDAPALATADLGIALGGGTALAADAADVAVVTDDLGSLETVFSLAEAANSRVRQNIGWAFLYNGVALPLAAVNAINPLFAALAMGASSLIVVTNSSRPLLGSE
jgi:Cu2+-exporting ATPase